MRILILGGTLFLGRAVAEAALAAGHEVTLFNRGRLPPIAGTKTLLGDRDGGLGALGDGDWDAVVDTSGYVPRLVRASAQQLRDRVGLYLFVSSISVYADFSRPFDEDAPLATMADGAVEEITGVTYGPLKVLCEQEVQGEYGDCALVVRPGLIVGPHDPTFRFAYWIDRIRRGGEVLAPGDPGDPVQLIDVRDLAEWMVRMIEARQAGTFNASGPDFELTMRQFLEDCRAGIGGDARFTWVDGDFLIERGVAPWSQLPLWMPSSLERHAFFHRARIERALAAGLTFRALAETARDTLAWKMENEGRPPAEKPGVQMADETLRPERERELLELWRRREAS